MSIDLPLGKPTFYPREYSPSILVGVPRADERRELGLANPLPFDGVDVWNAYELSWLNTLGKPVVALARLRIPASSPNLVESKSLKLYLSSLNGSRHGSLAAVEAVITADLERTIGARVEVQLTPVADADLSSIVTPAGECIDDADIEIDAYELDPSLLEGSIAGGTDVDETLHSRLLKTNCPITAQPDWATLLIRYRGPQIDRVALLRYIVSYRNHDGFHEHCAERIFADLKRHCRPHSLTVFARYTRRGGIDINPFRSDFETFSDDGRLCRQ
ncbi:MAG: 7-cyano-7-deazaguanine reductase [Chlamydiales bacterium]|jgi:7-cyano-7-deazaguanine reductase